MANTTKPPESGNTLQISTIPSDVNLQFNLDASYDFYLAPPNLDPNTDIDLQVRKAPKYDNLKSWLAGGFKTQTITVAYGVGIVVTEVVPTSTGVWVGFISDAITASQDNIFYTKIENVRAKAGVNFPAVVNRVLFLEDQIEPYIPPGAREVSPKDNQSWLTLETNDVRLVYYSFNEHNEVVIDPSDTGAYTEENIIANPTLGLSEGYYYFIIGQNRRAPQNEASGEIYGQYKTDEQRDQAVAESSQQSVEQARQNAYANLIQYLGKDQAQSADLINQFVLVDLKVNTQTSNPDNQKTIFAIKAEYVDALPQSSALYYEQFDSEIESAFLQGKDFSINLKLKNVQRIVDKLLEQFNKFKSKVEGSNLRISDANDVDFDIDLQMEEIKKIPSVLNDFMARQSFPAHTAQDNISTLASEGTNSAFDHIIQIGLRDNNEVGFTVRQTISHVLFSPDPTSLIGKDAQGNESKFDLFMFDPYLTDEELNDPTLAKRSATNLNIALPYLREKFSTTYGSRALHYLLAYTSIFKYFTESGSSDSAYDWADFLQKFSVPPLKIYTSADPLKASDREAIDCQEIIDRLNAAGPNVGLEEKLLQEQLYNNPECREAYFKQFSRATHAADPNLSRTELNKISNSLSDDTRKSSGNAAANSEAGKYLHLLYKDFFAVLDPESLMSLVIACLEKKLGVDNVIEAICEAAIRELILATGVEAVIALAIANALLAPNKESSRNILIALGEFSPEALEGVDISNEDGASPANLAITLDKRFKNAPIATAMAVNNVDLDGVFGEKGITIKIIEIIRNLEKSGGKIDFIPAARPPGSSGVLPVKFDLNSEDQNLNVDSVYTTVKYTKREIDQERKRYKQMGYPNSEVDVLLLQNKFVIPDPNQWLKYLNLQITPAVIASYLQNFNINLINFPVGSLLGDLQDPPPISSNDLKKIYTAKGDNQKNIADSDEFIDYLRNTIGLTALCEVILSDLFEGLEDFLKDPLGGIELNFFQDFIDRLVRTFKGFNFNFRFPDNLAVDSHMGDYFEKLLRTLILMIAKILGQIVRLLIKEALEKCLEENNDQGPAPSPALTRPASIAIPQLRLAGLPNAPPSIDDATLAAWLADMASAPLQVAQLCALLRGDASRRTLLDLVAKTRFSWPEVYASGIDTTAEIATIFKDLGTRLNLDICDFITPSAPIVVDLCDAVFDRDARCEELRLGGLTAEECQKQIDRELADLRNKVVALAGFTIGQDSLLNVGVPSPCGDDGFFQLPPGVQFAMNRITDNIVESVKGSLLVDMNALKFFTVPPPLVAAMNDRQKLDQIHGMFRNLNKKPFVKTCFAYIGNPYDETVPNSVRAKFYPITYNKFIHYGGYITKPGYFLPEDSTTEQEIRSSNIKNAYKDILSDFSDVSVYPEDPDKFLEETEWFEPVHVGMILKEPSSTNAFTKIQKRAKDAIVQAYADYLGFAASEAEFTDYEGIVGSLSIEEKEALAEKITSDYVNEDIKPAYMKDLVVTTDELLRINKKGGLLGPLQGPKKQGASLNARRRQRYTAKVYPLDTKLRDINGNGNRWYALMSYFTGVLMENRGGGFREWGGSTIQDNDGDTNDILIINDDVDNRYDLDREDENGDPILTDTQFPVCKPSQSIPSEKAVNTPDDTYRRYSKISPGFIRLIQLLEDKSALETINARIRHGPGQRKVHHWMNAFMELTVAEALGLTDDRLSELFPNFNSIDGVKGVVFAERGGEVSVASQDSSSFLTIDTTLTGEEVQQFLEGNSDPSLLTQLGQDYNNIGKYEKVQILPMYIAFDQVFIPENHPLALTGQDMYDFFALNNDPVNKEMLDRLQSSTEFDQNLGFTSAVKALPPALGSDASLFPERIISDNLETHKFDADVIKVNMPFTSAKLNSNGTSAGLDVQSVAALFTQDLNYQDIIDQYVNFEALVEETVKQDDLLYQNVGAPLQNNINLQLDSVRNVSKIAKAVIRPSQQGSTPPNIIDSPSKIASQKFNFDLAKPLPQDLQSLIDNLYSDSSGPISQRIVSEFNTETDLGIQKGYNSFNFKAQIFGKLLSQKIDSLLNQYKDSNQAGLSELEKSQLKVAFADYCYPALQSAYIHQSFSRLKDSRLQYRKGMRNLWKKILRVKGFNKNSDPECVNPLTESTALSNEQLQNTETDFFNIANVKQRILDYYQKSVCRDVYEDNTPEQNAGRIALLQGTLIMMVKIFTLEACFSGVIAWDSYDIADVIESELLINIIINNIQNELPEGISMELITSMATEVIKKDEGLSDVEFAAKRGEQSGLEYLIRKEAKSIERAIEGDKTLDLGPGARSNVGIFRNRNALTTDLILSVLKSSDQDFEQEYVTKIKLDLLDEEVGSDTKAEIYEKFGVEPPQELLDVPVIPDDEQLLQEAIAAGHLPEDATLIVLPEEVKFPTYPVADTLDFTNPFTILVYTITQFNKQPSPTTPPLDPDDANDNTIIQDAIDKSAEEYDLMLAHLQELIAERTPLKVLLDLGIATQQQEIKAKQLGDDINRYTIFLQILQSKINFYDQYQDSSSDTYKTFQLKYLGANYAFQQRQKLQDAAAEQNLILDSYRQQYELAQQYPLVQNQAIEKENQQKLEQLQVELDKVSSPQTFKAIFEATDVDFATDVRFETNIYTMNYGRGQKEKDIFVAAEQGFLEPTLQMNEQNLFDQKTEQDVSDVLHKNNRNFFHSLPVRGRYITGIHYPQASAIQQLRVASGNGFFDLPFSFDNKSAETSDFKNITAIQRDILGLSHSFTKENFCETTFGTKQNAKLGNVLFQPYVRLVDTTPEERAEMTIDIYQTIDTDSTGKPCEPKLVKFTFDASDYEEVFQQIDAKRNYNNNVFGCEMREYVPISAWSYFYNEIFMKTLLSYPTHQQSGLNPLHELYKKYGFTLMFKKHNFGLRLSYTIPAEIINNRLGANFDLTSKLDEILGQSPDSGTPSSLGTRLSKAILSQRPYGLFDSQSKASNPNIFDFNGYEVLDELSIPITEVEQELTINEGQNTFSIEGQEYNLDSLGHWNQDTLSIEFASQLAEEDNIDKLKHLVNNPHQFFYKNLSQTLVDRMKDSAEFKLMYDYMFPMKTYMGLGFIYAGEGLTKFIPKPTDILDESKRTIFMAMVNLLNSNDYTFLPDVLANQSEALAIRNLGGTTGKDPDMTKEILKIIYETMFLVLKNFVEITDPAVIIAKRIIDATNAIVTAALAAVETGLNTAKAALNGAKLAQKNLQQQVGMQVTSAASIANALKNTLAFPADPEDANSPLVKDLITIDIEGEDPEQWTVEYDDRLKPSSVEVVTNDEGEAIDENFIAGGEYFEKLPDENKGALSSFFVKLEELNDLISEYEEVAVKLKEINEKLEQILKEIEIFHRKAKNTMKEIFQSPYLLPALWGALLPSMTPYFGGLVPPPIVIGPPSTVPGMIYIALLLIDAAEEKIHDDVFSPEDPCIEEL